MTRYPPRPTFPLLLSSLVLFLLFLLLYSAMSAPELDWGDAGEAQLAAWTAGLSHPTGYPLFLLLGWLWTHGLALLGVPPTRAMTLMSVVAGATAVSLVGPMTHALLQRARPVLSAPFSLLLAILAALSFGLSPTFWSQALLAEVYTLNALFLVLLFWGLWEPRMTYRRARLLALLYGLALGHHRSALLWAPGLLLWTLLEWRSRDSVGAGAAPPHSSERGISWLLRRGAVLLFLIALPQLLYLYIPLRGPATAYLHQPLGGGEVLDLYDGSARAFLEHVSGSVFASALLRVSPTERLELLARLWQANAPVVTLLALVAFLPSRLMTGAGPLPLSDRLLLASGGAATLLFGLIYGIGDVEVMFIPLWLALTIAGWTGVALLAARLRGAGRTLPFLLLGGVATLLLSGHLAHAPASRAGLTAPRELVERLYGADPPENAILISNDRDEIVPLWYAQFAEGRRHDLLVLFPLVTPAPEHSNVEDVVEWSLQWERPVLLIKPMPALGLLYEIAPHRDTLYQVQGPAAVPTEPVLQGDMHPALTVTGWRPSTRRVLGSERVTVTLAIQVAEPLPEKLALSLQLFHVDGTRVGQTEFPPDPSFPASRWPTGEPLRLALPLLLPEGLEPGVYEWRLSAYTAEGSEVTPFGEQVSVGRFLAGEAPSPLAPTVENAALARFGESILLVDAVLPDRAPSPGETLEIMLRWAAREAPLRPYTLFVHLLDSSGQIVAQVDAPPAPPTDVWVSGDRWNDVRRLPLPAELPPGEYTLHAGLYDAAGRLPTSNGADFVDLYSFTLP